MTTEAPRLSKSAFIPDPIATVTIPYLAFSPLVDFFDCSPTIDVCCSRMFSISMLIKLPYLCASVITLPGYSVWICTFTTSSSETANNERSEEHTSELQSRGHLVCRL